MVSLHNTATTVPLLSTCTIQHGYAAFDSIPRPPIESIDDLSHRQTSNCKQATSKYTAPPNPQGNRPRSMRSLAINYQKYYLAAWTTPYGFPVSSQGVVTLGEGLVTGA